MNIAGIAVLALVPMMTGELPQDSRTITATICNGANQLVTIEIPLQRDGGTLPPPCHAKGCHAGPCRRKFDTSQ